MKTLLPFATVLIFISTQFHARAGTKVTVDHNSNGEAASGFSFKTVPPLFATNAAMAAHFTLVSGTVDSNSGGLAKLHDGALPEEEDQPGDNFFFAAGSDGGRVQVDLGSAIDIKEVNTYSWHPGSRGPQIYKVYGSDGLAEHFDATPSGTNSPQQSGWKLVAAVDTTEKGKPAGGQYGVSISDTDGLLGKYRYLLFDISATELDDSFGNTFYSEIEVVDANAPAIVATAVPVKLFTTETSDGKCEITINTAQAPDLKDWAETKLAPVLAEWYPKIVAMFPSEGFNAPTHFRVTFKPSNGVAYTAGRNVVANSTWIKKEIGREAIGSLVHETVHVVQQYGGRGARNPGWLVEGIADYVRFFKFEPQTHGADLQWLKTQRRSSLRYNESYRGSANFLNWVTEKYDTNIVSKLNAAMREGKYDDNLWTQYTGKSAPELGAEWKTNVLAQLPGTNAPPKTD